MFKNWKKNEGSVTLYYVYFLKVAIRTHGLVFCTSFWGGMTHFGVKPVCRVTTAQRNKGIWFWICSSIALQNSYHVTVHSNCPITIQIKCPFPIILLYIPMDTHIRILILETFTKNHATFDQISQQVCFYKESKPVIKDMVNHLLIKTSC